MTRATVEAIIVSYHSAAVLPECLESLAAWLGDQDVVTLVDNAPGDGSAEIARTVLPRINVIVSPGNIGFGAAVNSAIGRSNADVVLLVNPDCRVRSGRLEDVLSLFAEDERLAAVGTRMVDEDGVVARNCKRTPGAYDYVLYMISADSRFPRWRYPSEMRMADMDYAVQRPVESLSGAFMFIHRRALERVGNFDERFFMYCEETDWCLRAHQAGMHCLYTPSVTVEHEGGGSSEDVSVSRLTGIMLESQLKFVRKHYGRMPAFLNYIASLAFDLVRLLHGLFLGNRGRDRVRSVRDHVPVYLGLPHGTTPGSRQAG